MKHGSLIAPDEGSFGFGTSKTMFDSTSAGHQSGETVTVPDAALLFNGEFKRAGDDLKIIGQDGKSFLVEDYFKKDKHPTLLSPEGAALTPDVVDALAGPLAPGQYAQAGAPQSANQAIGRVEKVEGNATVVRNGVTITLNTGDVIQKGDVAQTGAGGSLAIVFSDGTAFNLAANARMVLNDFVYSAGGSNNSALISLVQGSISFVAGQVAKTGDMRVETPVATMGIRGTAVLVEVSANNGQTKFSVMVEPNGEVGSFNLYDKSTGNLIATVNSSSIGWVVTPTGPLQVLAQQVQKTPAELARELFIVQQVFQTFNSGPFDPNAPQPPQQPNDPNKRGDTDTNTKTAGGPSGTPGSVTGDVIKVNIVSPTGANGQTGPTNPTNPNPNDPNAGDPTGPGDPDGPGAPDGPTQTQTLSINTVYGSANNDNPLAGSDNDDMVFGGAGDDVFIAAHGKGNDFFDGDGDGDNPLLPDFEGPGFDTIRYDSASGVTFDLVGITELNHAFSASTGYDTFINIEKVVGSPGDDVFNLHANGDWVIDGGSDIETEAGHNDFDVIALIGEFDILNTPGGIEARNIEMLDLDNNFKNKIYVEGEGVVDINDAHIIRIVTDSKDTVALASDFDGNVGHWEFVSGRQSDAQLFGPDDHHSDTDGVSNLPTFFDKYIFVSDEGCTVGQTVATAYIDSDAKVVMEAPATLVEQGAVGDGTDETTVKLSHSDVNYDTTGWSYASLAGASEYNGHYYKHVLQEGLSWGAAQAAALAAGGYLANVTSQGESDFLTNLIDYAHGGYTAYIGATDTANEGNFVWQNGPEAGQGVTFTFWAYGEPNNNGGENYLIMVAGPGSNEGGHWNDVSGGARGYLIEYDSGYDTSTLIKSGIYGYVTLNTETNELTYHLDDTDAETQALAEGQTATDSFVIVVDENGTPVTHNVDFTIHGSNDAPELDSDAFYQSIPEQVSLGEEFSFALGTKAFTDVDAGDSLTYQAKLVDGDSLCPLPTWLEFDPATRTFHGTPPEGAADDYTIQVTATDTHGQSASETFTFTVEAPAPVLDLDADDSSGATGSGYQTAITFGTAIAVLDGDATITEASTLNSATIKLTGEGNGGYTDYPDTSLTIARNLLPESTGNGFSGSWHGISWSASGGSSGMNINITGTGTTADYLEILRAARMSFDEDTGNTAANVTITVNSDGGSDSATTVVDIPNRAPDINVYSWNSANAATDETDSPPELSGTLTLIDADRDLVTLTVTDLDADGPLGAHSVNDFLGFLWVTPETTSGTYSSEQFTWHFAPDNETFDYLAGGESLILHYTVHAYDGSASDDQIVNITINGTDETPPPSNEAPVIHTDAAYTSGDYYSTTLAGLSVTDAEASENPGEHYTVTASALHGTLSVSEGTSAPQIEFEDPLEAVNNKLGNGITYTNGEDDPYTTDDDNDTVTLTVMDANGASDTVNFLFKVFGEGGVSLTGGYQKDVLFGTGGNDTLEGGDNADTFVFDHNVGQCGIGHDTVNDFMVGVDKIDLGAGFNSVPTTGPVVDFNCWVNTPGAFTECNGNTTIHLSDNEDITLKNVQIAQLTANDFIIHPGMT